MEAPPLANLYNPSDTLSTGEFFKLIGEVTNNGPAWMNFHTAIMATAAASSIYLLKCMRDAEVDLALSSCKMSTGYKNALCEYLSPHGSATRQAPSHLRRRLDELRDEEEGAREEVRFAEGSFKPGQRDWGRGTDEGHVP